MRQRFVGLGAALLLAVPVAGVAPSAGAATQRPSLGTVKASPFAFSPNGDGRRDTTRVRYTLPKRTSAVLEITPAGRSGVVRRVTFPERAAGTYAWKWDGRHSDGSRAADGMYQLHLRLPEQSRDDAHAVVRVRLDTTMEISLDSDSRFSSDREAPLKVWPRTRVVTDAVSVRVATRDTLVRRLRLVIRDQRGRAVLRRNVNKPLRTTAGGVYGRGEHVAWTARQGGTLDGKPLPKGRYRAHVVGEDVAGNRARSEPMRVWVSRDRLVWAGQVLTYPAAENHRVPGGRDYSPCGEVLPSAVYPGGLSLRSAECGVTWKTDHAAATWFVEVPETEDVRGIHALRVSWTGAPTVSGESDVATLWLRGLEQEAPTTVPTVPEHDFGEGWQGASSTGLQTPWLYHPEPLGGFWSLRTEGTDSVEVKDFTVEMKYLVPAP